MAGIRAFVIAGVTLAMVANTALAQSVPTSVGAILDPMRGVLTFPAFKNGEDWLVFVYTATRFAGSLVECGEGDLEWVDDARLAALPLWEGDRIFLPWLEQARFFSGKFIYAEGRLARHEVSFYG